MPSYTALSFAQTPDGYLWISTFAGLTRFDGVQMKLIDPQTTPGAPGRNVLALYVDRRGWLWASRGEGVACLRDGHWVVYGKERGITDASAARTFLEDSDGNLMVSSQRGLFRFDGERFSEAPFPLGTFAFRCRSNSEGNLYAAGPSTFAVFQDRQWRVIPLPETLRAENIHGFARGRDASMLLAGKSRIYRYRQGVWTTIPANEPANFSFYPMTLLEDSAGQIWAGDYVAGLTLFRPDGSVLHFTRADGMPNLAIRQVFEDAEHNVWVGTDGGGMARIRPRVATIYDDAAGLPDVITDSVAEIAPGRMLVSTYGGGLIPFDGSQARFGAPIHGGGKRDWFGPSMVLSLLRGPEDVTWAGTVGRGLFQVRGNTVGRIPSCEARGLSVWSLFRASNGALWMGGDFGLASCLDGVFTQFGAEAGLPKGTVEAIAETGDGQIWAGGSAGLFHGRGNRFEAFLPTGSKTYSPISALYVDRAGILWIGSRDAGLDALRGSQTVPIFPALGLPPMRVASLIEDASHRIWAGLASRGLLAIGRPSLDAILAGRSNGLPYLWLNKEDGLATNNFRAGFQPVVTQASDGKLWFATLKGVTVVDPGRIAASTWVPPVWIESVSLNGKPVSFGPTGKAAVTAEPGSRRLQVFYSGLSLTAPERVRFQYRLDGLDPDWQDATERSVSFSDLRPGGYVFRVRAGANNGLWNEHNAVLSIRIQPFFWETTWFWCLTALSLVGGTAFLVHRAQQRKLQRQAAQLAGERALRENLERVQAVLRTSEERFSTAFNSSPLPFTVIGADGRFVDANERFLRTTGHRREEVIGHTREELNLWADPEQYARFQAMVTNGIPVRDFEALIRTRSGQVTHQLLSVEPINLMEQPCFLVASQDMTERKRLEEQLSQAQRLESVGRLAGGVAHDFNNLLTIINGYSDLLLQRPEVSAQIRSRVEQIRNAGTRAAELTHQLLAFSRKQVIEPRRLDLNALVAETGTMLRRVVREDIEIVTHLDPGLGLVMADPGQTHQVLLNLAVNARDSMPNGGQLIIETANEEFDARYLADHPEVTAGKYVLLIVSDTGVGMNEQVRHHIFEPFFTTKEQGKGTGLGLSTVYGIVRQSGGWIWVHSEPGKGSTFKIYLPRVEGEPEEPDAIAGPSGDVKDGRETVLLVEDQAEVRLFAKEALQSYGYRVMEAENGNQALAMAQQFRGYIDLLLTDLVMPGLTGREVAQRLVLIHPETKVLYMSGYAADVIVHQGVLEPGVAYLPKPFTPDALAAKVRESLDRAG